MFKNKFKSVFILITILMILFSTLVFAEDDAEEIIEEIPTSDDAEYIEDIENTEDIENVESINDIENSQNLINETDEENAYEDSQETDSNESKIVNNSVYLFGDNITIDYVIDGNAFITANKVTIQSQIHGNAFICANEINISETGLIANSLYATSSSINIKGDVNDLYAITENTTISGYIYRDINVHSKNLDISGTIDRDANVDVNNLTFSKNENNEENYDSTQGRIMGNLNYTSSKELQIPQGIVSGKVTFKNDFSILEYIFSAISFIILVSVIWLLLNWKSPKFAEKAENLIIKKPLSIIGFGVLSFIAIPIVSIALLISEVASSVGLILLAIYIILICISTSILIIALNSIICKKLKFTKPIKTFGILIVTSVVAYLLTLIPYVGSIINLIYIILGLGIVTKNLISKKDK